MSLLMEALRKAEAQKRKVEQERPAGDAGGSPPGDAQEGHAETGSPVSAGASAAESAPASAPKEASGSVPSWFGRGGRRSVEIPNVELPLEAPEPAPVSPAFTLETVESSGTSPAPSAGLYNDVILDLETVEMVVPEAPSQDRPAVTAAADPEPTEAVEPTVPLSEPARPTASPARNPSPAAVPPQPRVTAWDSEPAGASTKARSRTGDRAGRGVDRATGAISPRQAEVAAQREPARAMFAAKQQRRSGSPTLRLAVLGVLGIAVVGGIGTYVFLATRPSGIGVNVDLALAQRSQEDLVPAVQVIPDPGFQEVFDDAVPTEEILDLNTDAAADFDDVAFTDEPVVASVTAPSIPVAVPEPPVRAPASEPILAPVEPVSQAPDVAVATTAVAEAPVPPVNAPAPVAAMPAPTAVSAVTAVPPAAVANPTGNAAESSVAPTPTPVVLRRSETRTGMPAALAPAYAAYQRGDFPTAANLYREVLTEEPLHRDALVALAAMARLLGDATQAREWYARLLTRDPRDPVARAGLLELAGGNPAAQERELLRLRAQNPQEPSLAYALGNHYAGQGRWPEAQQLYFDALQLARSQASGPGTINPDYAFNLAVSLDRLNQPAAALGFYREAAQFAQSHPAGFDMARLQERLRQEPQD